MNNDWSDKNKKMQTLISKEATFDDGIKVLLELRVELFEQITSIVKTFPPEAFYQLPFGDGEGSTNFVRNKKCFLNIKNGRQRT